MADLAAIRKELAEAMKAQGLRAYADNPAQLHAPAAIVEPDNVDFRGAMQRGTEQWRFLIRYLCGTASVRAAEQERDKVFGGVKDIKDAIESHIPLRDGTAADDVFVAEARRFDSWEYAGVVYLGVEFQVEVYAS